MYHSSVILGTKVDLISKEEFLRLLDTKYLIQNTEKRLPFFIVTANAEFLLEAQKNPGFKNTLGKANLILPDGISLIQAHELLKSKSKNPILLFFRGLYIGLKTLKGGYQNKTITGVEILNYFIHIKQAGAAGILTGINEKNSNELRREREPGTRPREIKIFFLGGHQAVSKILADKYQTDYLEGPSDITKITQKENNALLQLLNNAKPDILFVSFGHFKQEVWIAQNLEKLSAKVVIGIGSAFDEIAGIGQWSRNVPNILQTIGFKWLWRLYKNPSHIGRVFNAVIIFPIKVYISKLSS